MGKYDNKLKSIEIIPLRTMKNPQRAIDVWNGLIQLLEHNCYMFANSPHSWSRLSISTTDKNNQKTIRTPKSILFFYQVRQGRTWSRNYKSPSSPFSPSSSPTRVRIYDNFFDNLLSIFDNFLTAFGQLVAAFCNFLQLFNNFFEWF
jgi:hypothetical protein